MPTYEYRCPAGHDFERFYRKMSDASAQVECPECGKIAERLMSVGGFAFKGSGFYLTDYGKNAHRGGAPPAADGGGDSATPAAAAAGDSTSGSKETASTTKENSPASSDAKPATAVKPPAEAKPAPESKPAKSGGSTTSKDK